MPNARTQISKTNAGIRNNLPNVRLRNFQTGRAGENTTILAGTPIGLLLSLTYATDISTAGILHSDYRPNARIRAR